MQLVLDDSLRVFDLSSQTKETSLLLLDGAFLRRLKRPDNFSEVLKLAAEILKISVNARKELSAFFLNFCSLFFYVSAKFLRLLINDCSGVLVFGHEGAERRLKF